MCVVSEQNVVQLRCGSNLKRRLILFVSVSTSIFPALSAFGKTKGKSPFDERRLLEQNRRIQRENNVPDDFPNFVREGSQQYIFSLLILLSISCKLMKL